MRATEKWIDLMNIFYHKVCQIKLPPLPPLMSAEMLYPEGILLDLILTSERTTAATGIFVPLFEERTRRQPAPPKLVPGL